MRWSAGRACAGPQEGRARELVSELRALLPQRAPGGRGQSHLLGCGRGRPRRRVRSLGLRAARRRLRGQHGRGRRAARLEEDLRLLYQLQGRLRDQDPGQVRLARALSRRLNSQVYDSFDVRCLRVVVDWCMGREVRWSLRRHVGACVGTLPIVQIGCLKRPELRVETETRKYCGVGGRPYEQSLHAFNAGVLASDPRRRSSSSRLGEETSGLAAIFEREPRREGQHSASSTLRSALPSAKKKKMEKEGGEEARRRRVAKTALVVVLGDAARPLEETQAVRRRRDHRPTTRLAI